MTPLKTKFKLGIVAALLATFCLPVMAEDAKPTSGRDFLLSCSMLMSDGTEVVLDASKDSNFIEKFKKEVGTYIIGQDPAIDAIALILEKIESMMNDPEKPLGKFLFVGPTGVGKTELARAIVRFFGGDPDTNMIRIDGGEMQQDHENSRVIGAPSGYAGYGDPPLLHPDNIAAAKLKFTFDDGSVVEFTIILADEIEKASAGFQKLFLGILDNGKVTLGDTTPSYVRKAIIIGTSNKGAKDVEKLIDQKKEFRDIKQAMVDALIADPGYDGKISGYTAEQLKVDRENPAMTPEDLDLTGRVDMELRAKILDTYVNAIKDDDKFAPEWVNRWDGIIQFLHLGNEEFLKISNIFLAKAQKRIFRRAKTKFGVTVTDEARKWLVDQGTDFRNGARELAGVIEKQMVRGLSKMISTGEVNEGDVVEVRVVDNKLAFVRIAEGLTRPQLLEFADAEYPGMKMAKVEFDEQIDEPIEDSNEIAKVIARQLQANQVAANHLFNEALKVMPEPPEVKAGVVQGNGNAVLEARVQYVKIGDHTYRLTANFMRDKTTGKVIEDPVNNKVDVLLTTGGVPQAFHHLFTTNTIKKFTVSEIEAIIKAAEKQSGGN